MELHCAAEEGDFVKVQECLAGGVPPDIRDERGRTALMLSKKLAFEIVDVLLEAGADPNARDQNGDTPFLEQYAAGSPVMVDELERAYQENCGEKLKIHRTTI